MPDTSPDAFAVRCGRQSDDVAAANQMLLASSLLADVESSYHRGVEKPPTLIEWTFQILSAYWMLRFSNWFEPVSSG